MRSRPKHIPFYRPAQVPCNDAVKSPILPRPQLNNGHLASPVLFHKQKTALLASKNLVIRRRYRFDKIRHRMKACLLDLLCVARHNMRQPKTFPCCVAVLPLLHSNFGSFAPNLP
ncbi:MAG TPA: hypothetical protein DEQ20_00560 [Desulfobulbaceae bacterium]|nr:hypothetical protein [Desulfobulbaceae bacterium]